MYCVLEINLHYKLYTIKRGIGIFIRNGRSKLIPDVLSQFDFKSAWSNNFTYSKRKPIPTEICSIEVRLRETSIGACTY